MTTQSTRQRALQWWNDLEVYFKSVLINKYGLNKTIFEVSNREIEDLYTKINHN